MKTPKIEVQIITLVVVALLTVTGCSTQKPPKVSPRPALPVPAQRPVLVFPNEGVGKVRQGMNQQQVEAAIGKPEKVNGKFWFYLHRGLFVAFDNDGVLFNVKCTRPFAGVTKEGIGIGSKRTELLAAYGNPSQEKIFPRAASGAAVSTSGSSGGFANFWYASLGISFDLQADKVTSFIVHLDPR
jgi:outer membrane protein assembly factor BamE (lipoprotein component of BamABCDE complex)